MGYRSTISEEVCTELLHRLNRREALMCRTMFGHPSTYALSPELSDDVLCRSWMMARVRHFGAILHPTAECRG